MSRWREAVNELPQYGDVGVRTGVLKVLKERHPQNIPHVNHGPEPVGEGRKGFEGFEGFEGGVSKNTPRNSVIEEDDDKKYVLKKYPSIHSKPAKPSKPSKPLDGNLEWPFLRPRGWGVLRVPFLQNLQNLIKLPCRLRETSSRMAVLQPISGSEGEIPAWTGEDSNPPAICLEQVEPSCGSCQSFSPNQSSPASGRGLCMKDPPPGETLRLPEDGKDCPGYHGAGTTTREQKLGAVQVTQRTPSIRALDSSDPDGQDEPTTPIPDREHWREQAMSLYRDLPATLPPERGRELAAIPGWMDRLDELESEYQARYDKGQDCTAVLQELEAHWRIDPHASHKFDRIDKTDGNVREPSPAVVQTPQLNAGWDSNEPGPSEVLLLQTVTGLCRDGGGIR